MMDLSPADAPMALLAAIVEAYPRNPGCNNVEVFIVKMRDVFLPAYRSMVDGLMAQAPEAPQLIMESPRTEEE